MAVQVEQGTVIYRLWDQQMGLSETSSTFASLADLFELCLQVDDPLMVDRVVIAGRDADGSRRTVTLTFQSVTISDGDTSSS